MKIDSEALQQFITELLAEIKQAVPVVTGYTASNIEAEFGEGWAQILAPAYVDTFESGRGPTTGGNNGGPTVQQRMLAYIKAKGIIATALPSGRIPTPEQLSWAMANSIHKKGFAARHPGVFSNIITEGRITAFIKTFATEQSAIASSQIVQVMKGLEK